MTKAVLSEKMKNKLQELAKEVERRLEAYWKDEMGKNFGFEKKQKELTKEIFEHAREHNLRTAKRLRASLVYYGYLLGARKMNEEVWKAMEAMELVQTALLMHDDFMDEDELRRGLPTTQIHFGQKDRHYGESMAVDIGDIVLCLGYERLMSCNLETERVLKAAKILMRGIAETALGQAYDVSLPVLGDLTEEKVLAVHRSKTAIYTFQNPLMIGGILSGLTEVQLETLKEYAIAAGVAFQLQDDVLGMYGDSGKTGKSSDSDLRQGKGTLLISRVLEVGNGEQKRAVAAAWGNKEAGNRLVEEAKKAIIESGAKEYSVEKAKKLAEKAGGVTEKMREMGMNEEAVDYLAGLTEYLVSREV